MRSLSDYSNKRATQGPKDQSYTDALHRRSIETRYRERWVQHWLFVHFLFCKRYPSRNRNNRQTASRNKAGADVCRFCDDASKPDAYSRMAEKADRQTREREPCRDDREREGFLSIFQLFRYTRQVSVHANHKQEQQGAHSHCFRVGLSC